MRFYRGDGFVGLHEVSLFCWAQKSHRRAGAILLRTQGFVYLVLFDVVQNTDRLKLPVAPESYVVASIVYVPADSV